MRTLTLFLFATALGSFPALHAADAPFPPGYSRESYVNQAALELRQIRIQVDTTARKAPLSAQGQFSGVYDALADAEQALNELRNADDAEIAKRRVNYEQLRIKALRLWREFHLVVNDGESPKN